MSYIYFFMIFFLKDQFDVNSVIVALLLKKKKKKPKQQKNPINQGTCSFGARKSPPQHPFSVRPRQITGI